MFVYYLDSCLTAYWQLFVLSLWVVTLLFIAINGRKALLAPTREAALRDSGIRGAAYERLKPNLARIRFWLFFWCLASVGILYGYAEFFGDFKCSPESILWIGPKYGAPPA